MNKAEKIINYINIKLGQLTGLLLFMIIVLLTVNVLSREIGRSISGLTTISVLVMIAIVYLGLSVSEQNDEHASVDILSTILTTKWLNANKIFINLLSLATLGLFFYKSIGSVVNSYKINEMFADVVDIPIWPSKLAISIGLFFFMVQILFKLIENFIFIFKKET